MQKIGLLWVRDSSCSAFCSALGFVPCIFVCSSEGPRMVRGFGVCVRVFLLWALSSYACRIGQQLLARCPYRSGL